MIIAMDTRKKRLLDKYDLSIENFSYDFIRECSNKKILEKIVRVLRSKEEGSYPHLQEYAEDRLHAVAPDSRVLRHAEPVLASESLDHDHRKELSDDLKQFTTEIKMQEDRVCSAFAKRPSLPAVRTSEWSNEAGEKVAEPRSTVKTVVPRAYSEWDKYDADKELKKIEIEEEKEKERSVMLAWKKNSQASKIEEVDTHLQLNILRDVPQEEAPYLEMREKEKGNECFRAGEYAQAILHYTTCLQLRRSADLFNNRAMAHLKLGRYPEAVEDCNRALEMDPDNAKAYYRRSSAHQKLCNFTQARDDMARVMQLQPDLQLAKKVHSQLEKQCASQKRFRMPITDVVSEDVGHPGKNVEMSRHKTLDVNACRTMFVENTSLIGGSNKKAVEVVSGAKIVELPEPGDEPSRPSDCTKIIEVVDSRSITQGGVGRSGKSDSVEEEQSLAWHSDSVEITVAPEETTTAGVARKQGWQRASKKCDVCLMEGKGPSYKCQWLCTPPKTPAKYGQKQPGRPGGGHVQRAAVDGRASALATDGGDAGRAVFRDVTNKSIYAKMLKDGDRVVNTTSPYNFVKMWHLLLRDGKSDLADHAYLLRNLSASQLPAVLGNKLDAEMLATILKCLDRHFDAEADGSSVAEHLDGLSRVQRFQTVSLLLDPEEKEVAHRLVRRLTDAGFTPTRFVSKFSNW